ncbi:hypothetical protein EWM64_g10549, partial [Hericium alpestre]
VEDDVRALLERQDESDKMLEESMILMLRQKRDKDQGTRREIEELFGASVQGAQEILRRFDIAAPLAQADKPVDLEQNSESVDKESVSLTSLHIPKQASSSLPPSPLPEVPEAETEPQEWDFVDYEDGVVLGSGMPKRKPPALFTESYEPEVSTPANSMPREPVDNKVVIPIAEWTVGAGSNAQEIKVNGARFLKDGVLELSVKFLDGQMEPGALQELTHGLTKYHHGTMHKLASNPCQWDFVSVKSSHGTAWHRGRILRVFGRDAEVLFIDSGFQEIVSVQNIRPLPTLFRFLPQQARMARLSFVEFPDAQSQHRAAALEALQKACVGRTLAAKLDYERQRCKAYMNGTTIVTELPPLHLRLMDRAVDSDDILMSINGQLLRKGLVTVDSELCRSIETYQSIPCLLAKAIVTARKEGSGMYRR